MVGQSIIDVEKQSIQRDAISEKSKIPTLSTYYGPKILPPVAVPIQNALSQVSLHIHYFS